MSDYNVTMGTSYFRSMRAAAKYYGQTEGDTCAHCGSKDSSGMDVALSKVQAGEIHIGQPDRDQDEIRRWSDEDGRLHIQYRLFAEVG